jgi:hypothetical protein
MPALINFDMEKFPVLRKKDTEDLYVFNKEENPGVLIEDFNINNSNLLRCFHLNQNEGEAKINYDHYEDIPYSNLELVWVRLI